MRNVVLIFPDSLSLSDFLLAYQPSNCVVESRELTLSAILSDACINMACAEYGASLKTMVTLIES